MASAPVYGLDAWERGATSMAAPCVTHVWPGCTLLSRYGPGNGVVDACVAMCGRYDLDNNGVVDADEWKKMNAVCSPSA